MDTTRLAQASQAATVGGCPLFPADNVWNQDISRLPVHANSAQFIASIGLDGHVHPDFGAGLYDGGPIGIPYVVVPEQQSRVSVRFDYADESDGGPYPIPRNVPIEGGASSGGDRHVIVVKSGSCQLYELYASYPQSDGSWKAGSGAQWSLLANTLRPQGWTSADAAGLPILPGLVRYDEVVAGAIQHALRFTVSRTQSSYLWPARHFASSNNSAALPPMGLRVRLKASVDISAYSAQNRVILTALKRYGMMVADNGSNWFLSGAPDERWNNDDLAQLGKIQGRDFEVVDEASLQISSDSAQARGVPAPSASPNTTATASKTPGKTATTDAKHNGVVVPALASPTASATSSSQEKPHIKGQTTPSVAPLPAAKEHLSPLLVLSVGSVALLGLGTGWLLVRRRARKRK